MIRSSLSLLKIFKFYFKFEGYRLSDIQIKEIIASFSTPFYVLEKKWFIHCEICSCCVTIYSIPFVFKRFRTFRCSIKERISTSLDNGFLNNKYANVKTLTINHMNAEPDENFKKTSVVNLIVNVDLDFIKWIHVLTQLRHLDILSSVRTSSNNLVV